MFIDLAAFLAIGMGLVYWRASENLTKFRNALRYCLYLNLVVILAVYIYLVNGGESLVIFVGLGLTNLVFGIATYIILNPKWIDFFRFSLRKWTVVISLGLSWMIIEKGEPLQFQEKRDLQGKLLAEALDKDKDFFRKFKDKKLAIPHAISYTVGKGLVSEGSLIAKPELISRLKENGALIPHIEILPPNLKGSPIDTSTIKYLRSESYNYLFIGKGGRSARFSLKEESRLLFFRARVLRFEFMVLDLETMGIQVAKFVATDSLNLGMLAYLIIALVFATLLTRAYVTKPSHGIPVVISTMILIGLLNKTNYSGMEVYTGLLSIILLSILNILLKKYRAASMVLASTSLILAACYVILKIMNSKYIVVITVLIFFLSMFRLGQRLLGLPYLNLSKIVRKFLEIEKFYLEHPSELKKSTYPRLIKDENRFRIEIPKDWKIIAKWVLYQLPVLFLLTFFDLITTPEFYFLMQTQYFGSLMKSAVYTSVLSGSINL
jgi:hypothetical protein